MTVIAATAGRAVHRPVGTGPAYWGPGDHYTFLVTGEESAGSTFAMEALVPPGGGPPPHVHRREDETFYVLDGELEFLLGEELVTGRTGDVVFVPRGTVHRFRNADTGTARLLLVFTPAGMERFFEETLESAPNEVTELPDNVDEVAARYVEAAPRHGLEFV